MAISSMIVQPAAHSLKRITEELSNTTGVTVHSVTPKQEIIIVVEAASLDGINKAARTIEAISGVLGVFPAYVTTADEDGANN